VEGDLLKITHTHEIQQANKNGIWPKIFLENLITFQQVIAENKIVLAIDPKPRVGKPAIIRVIHDGKIWVINSNFVERVWPGEQKKKTPCIIVNPETC